MAITKIATVEVGSGGATSIDFNSIPGTYTDLYLVLSSRFNNGSSDLKMSINGSTTTFTGRYLYGTSAGSGASASATVGYIGTNNPSTYTANTFGSLALTIPNYAGATNKSYSADSVGENNATSSAQIIYAGQWATASAITSLSIYDYNGTGSFVQYSSATLYGILKGSSGGVTVS